MRNNKLIYFAGAAVLVFSLWSVAFEGRYEIYASRYIETSADSRGAMLRVLVTALPALGYLLIRHRLRVPEKFERMLTILAWCSMVAVIALPVFPSTVAIDRLAKYFLPLHLFFFPAFSSLFTTKYYRALLVFLFVLYFSFVQFYWLFSSPLARAYWLPYQMAGL